MNSDYVEKKYPLYDIQRKLINSHKYAVNDFNAKNIENTLKIVEKHKEDLNTQETPKMLRSNNNRITKHGPKMNQISNSASSTRKPILKETFSKENVKEVSMIIPSNTAPHAANKKVRSSPLRARGLEGYDLVDDFKTGPPVGWKRPASTTSIMVRKMLENKHEAEDKKPEELKRNKYDKDIYFEAIYREDCGGQIFMKYLQARHKKVR